MLSFGQLILLCYHFLMLVSTYAHCMLLCFIVAILQAIGYYIVFQMMVMQALVMILTRLAIL